MFRRRPGSTEWLSNWPKATQLLGTGTGPVERQNRVRAPSFACRMRSVDAPRKPDPDPAVSWSPAGPTRSQAEAGRVSLRWEFTALHQRLLAACSAPAQGQPGAELGVRQGLALPRLPTEPPPAAGRPPTAPVGWAPPPAPPRLASPCELTSPGPDPVPGALLQEGELGLQPDTLLPRPPWPCQDFCLEIYRVLLLLWKQCPFEGPSLALSLRTHRCPQPVPAPLPHTTATHGKPHQIIF